MARRKWDPRPVGPTGGRRLIELGKDLLIVGLVCSAVFLAGQTPMVTQFRGWIAEPVQTDETAAYLKSEAVVPCGLSVRNSYGLYGVSYDEALVGQAFERTSARLGEALATAGEAEHISRRQWQALLGSPGVCCIFQGAPPLEVLSAWLGGGGELTGRAQALLLAWDGSEVWLCWRDGNAYGRARTQVAYEGHLEPVLSEFNPNGAAYAYTLAQEDDAYESLDPYVLISMTPPQPQIYDALAPDPVGEQETLERLLSALGFQSGVDFAYEVAGDLAINENGDRLRVSSAGQVTFHAGEEPRYRVACQGDAPTAAEAALSAWDLLNRAMGPWKNDGDYVLTGIEETDEGWIVSFQARLGGVPVWMGERGEAARFTVEGRQISDFTLALRTYTSSGAAGTLLGERLAAAALSALPESGGRLVLRYGDSGGGQLTAGWRAEDRI